MTSRPADRPSPFWRRRVVLIVCAAAVIVGLPVLIVILRSSDHKTPTRSPRAVGTSNGSLASGVSTPTSSAPSLLPSSDINPPALPSAQTESSSGSVAIASASSADPQAVLKQQVIRGYLTFERTLNQQLAVIAPDMIPLQGVATGQVLASSEDAVAELRGKGEVQRGAPTFTDVVVSSFSSPTTAQICATEDDGPTAIVVAKTGVVVASGFPRYKAFTTMVLDGRTWKASVASSAESC
jgi:hypothetical protein